MRRTTLTLSLCLPLLCSPTLGAQDLDAQESFDYGQKTGVGDANGKDGGGGFVGPWYGPANIPTLGGYWKFDDNVNDLHPTRNNGTLAGATYSTDRPAAIMSHSTKSLSFNGTATDYVDLSAHVGDYRWGGMGTISAWFKTGGTGAHTIFAASNKAEASREVRLIVEKGNLIWDVRGDMTSGGNLNSMSAVNDQKWHHACVTVDRYGIGTLYLDGKQVAKGHEPFFSSVIGNNGTGLDTMGIGRNVDSGGPQWFWTGNIDDVAIWGEPLDATTVMQLATGRNPLTVRPARTVGGPHIQPESLASASFPHAEFGGRGLKSHGNRISDAVLATRIFKREIDLTQDRVDYISFLIRREDKGTGTVPFRMRFRDKVLTRAWFGWNSSAMFQTGARANGTTMLTMQDKVSYFVVMKFTSKSGAQVDEVATKIYGPADKIHASDSQLSGVGTGANQWTWISQYTGAGNARSLDRLVLDPEGPDTIIDLDEWRQAKTWDAATRLGYGKGCHNAAIGHDNLPRVGATNYAVTLSGGTANSAALLILGISKKTWGAIPLPFDMTPVNAPGCFLNASFDVILGAATDSSGNASFPVALPSDTNLVSTSLYWQWGAVTNANGLGLAMSDGLEALIVK